MHGNSIPADRGVKKDSVSNISFKLNNVKDGVNKVISKFPCNHCVKTFTENQELNNHMKSVHKDHFINILEKRLEMVDKENKQYVSHTQSLIKDLEKLKIENKELLTLTKGGNTIIVKSPGDKYDQEDVVELDSEQAIVDGKSSGFRRDGPQAPSTQRLKCIDCGYSFNDKGSDRYSCFIQY